LLVTLVLVGAACDTASSLNASSAGGGGLSLSLGHHQEVAEGETVSLVGTLDYVGEDVQPTWSQIAGPDVVLEGADTLKASFVAPQVTEDTVLEFELLVLASRGREVVDHTTVLVLNTNTPPTVDAGADQTVAEEAQVTLTGSAGDDDGTVVATEWTQVTGPVVSLEDATELTASFSAPKTTAPQVLNFRLTVTDDEGATATDLVTVTVLPDNLLPTVDAGQDQVVMEGTEVALAGVASDPDGSVASVEWTQLGGPPVSLEDPAALETTFVAPATPVTAVVFLRLVVTDDEGGVASDVVSITVASDNQPPEVDAGAAQTVLEGGEVTLEGTASDPDGSIASVAWTQVAGPAVALSDPESLEPTFTAPATTEPVALTFQLAVADDEGATAMDVVSVSVLPDNQPPTADAGLDQVVDDGTTVTLAGAAADPDGEVAGVEWTQLTGPAVVLSDPTDLAPTFVAPAVPALEMLTFQLTVTDDEGAAASDWVTVTVMPNNLAPVADAGPDQTVSDGASVTLAGTASDPDGAVASTEWVQVSGPSVVLSDPTALTTTFTAPTSGVLVTLVFELTVTDDEGATASDVVAVSVVPSNLPPVAEAGDGVVVDEGVVVTLTGAASDPDGTVASTVWTQVGGPAVTLSDPSALQPTFTAPTTSALVSLTFQLTVTDDEGATASDVVVVTVAPVNAPPVADAGDDQTVSEQTEVTLVGGAFDSDGGVASTVWTQIGGPTVVLSDETSLTTTFTTPPTTTPQTLVFQLTVTDDEGALAVDTVVVAVMPVNLPPVVSAGVDTSAVSGETVQLQGSANDPDGTLAQTTWSQVGGTSVTLSDPAALTPTFTAPDVVVPEVLTFELAAQDDEGAVTTDQVQVQVAPLVPTNVPPSAEAGGNQTQASGTTVQLAGGASDSDGTVVSTAWAQVSGPSVVLNNATTLTPSFQAPVVQCAAVLVFELTVTDDEGAQGTDQVTVIVEGVSAGSVAVGELLDLEADDGGLVTEGTTWAWGVPTNGPGAAYSGGRVWATNLTGNYGQNLEEFLCLPAVDRAAVSGDLSFSWRSSYHMEGYAGITLEGLDPAVGWVPLTDVEPAYDLSVGGRPAWGSTPHTKAWNLFAARIPAWLGSVVRLRFVLKTENWTTAPGAYLDDMRFDAETDDPDGDGLPGIFDEWLTYGTDPLIADTDGDGISDGAEVSDGTDPSNPADLDGQTMLVPGTFLDFEADDGGLVQTGDLWQWGAPGSGPKQAASGNKVWATNLVGNYGQWELAYLYLPPVDLRGQTNATLSFRLWLDASDGDGLSMEAWDETASRWVPLAPNLPAYDGIDPLHAPAWTHQSSLDHYTTVAVSLAAYDDSIVKLRLRFASDKNTARGGAYLDDLAVDLESADPDGDGVAGILGELQTGPMAAQGVFTEPYVTDTDGDGANDGAEYAAGTDPSNPADYPGVVPLSAGDVRDFEGDAGGLATLGDTWQWGAVASGPNTGASGVAAWGTNLSGSYDYNLVEYLYLPPVDLAGATNPTLAFRLWSDCAGGDGVSWERFDSDTGWIPLDADQPVYDAVDAAGVPAWRVQRGPNGYVWVGTSLAEFAGEQVKLRLVLRTDGTWVSSGAYIDDLALFEETDDPDGDGIAGGLDEFAQWGTDPGLWDTDGDGHGDGEEVSGGTDPLNPADYPGGPQLTLGTYLDFEDNAGGLATWGGDTWQWGAVASGPNIGASGVSAWGTNLSGYYELNQVEYLYFPPVDLTGTTNPTLAFRLWSDCANGDGVSWEWFTADSGWVPLDADQPVYDAVDAAGVPAWRSQRGPNGYVWVGTSLAEFAGEQVKLRLVLRTDGTWVSTGAYIDDLALFEETDDPDGDGLVGGLDEYALWGTDPGLWDTDGDGHGDGEEVSSGTDPLNVVDFPGSPHLTPGTYLDFESGDGGLSPETGGTWWERGAPGSGPGVAWSGTQVWATNLSGNYGHNVDEGLLLPPADLSATARPTLGFRLWLDATWGDGLGVEVQDTGGAWVRLLPGTPSYESTDALGVTAWRDQRGPEGYVQVLVDLSAWSGSLRPLRLVFRSDSSSWAPGAYIDDLSLDDETSDPDGDGLVGILDEFTAHGTDPYRADTDGDGVDDGAEVTAGTDPLDPASS